MNRLSDEELKRWEVGLEMSKPQHAGYDFVQVRREQFTLMLIELQERRSIVGYRFEGKMTNEDKWKHLGDVLWEPKKTTFGDLKPGERFRVVVECEKLDDPNPDKWQPYDPEGYCQVIKGIDPTDSDYAYVRLAEEVERI